MGNQISNGSSATPATGKVILLDGSIQEFDKPLTVAELMLEYPQQVVVELKVADHHDSAQIQNNPIRPLPADQLLGPNKFYLMVPLRRSGKPARLTSQDAHHILLRARDLLKSKNLNYSSMFVPFFAKICPAGDSSFKVVGPPLNSLEAEEREKEDKVFDEQPDYLRRTLSGKGWKPSLDPIEEKKNEIKKGSNWVSLASKVGKRIHTKGLVWG